MIRRLIAPSFDPAWSAWMDSLPVRCDEAGPEQRLPGGRNELLLFENQGRLVVVKRFRNRGAWKKIAYRISSSKARRSYEHSLRLIEAGLHSPTPIGWLEVWRGPWLHQSFYVCDFLEFAHDASSLQDPELPNRIEKADLLGRNLARLHESGIAHLDLNSGNLLFSQSSVGEWKIHIIDNNRMRFGPISPKLACSLIARASLQDDILDIALNTYAQQRSYPCDSFRARYLATRSCFLLKRRIRDATRPWRKRIGL
ncbi:lipopolysaccharide kinase InaA family protein [Pelagicoccus sp. SDUM812003]|uniref:lipopolysaccharide kinase InaA family protein n=1 Tax=Pelagicoccus sp. SDUM812003 TaxID=3041267 RepID=UPI00280D365A|nr:lipopolysaccharide kinase InaA family protein [Pelagicoccus sp. SDUM812003]MDQ8203207.1 lipopolysaccharide kinase InaA family protein [Pelagicoccus sp. SDUM812003]